MRKVKSIALCFFLSISYCGFVQANSLDLYVALSMNSEISMHPDSMDTIQNKSELDVNVYFVLNNNAASRRGAAVDSTAKLKKDKRINLDQKIMRGNTPFKLIIEYTVDESTSDPRKKGIQVKFNEHFAPYSVTSKLTAKNKVEIIYNFPTGKPLVDQDHKHNEKENLIHSTGHICDPTSEVCG